MKTKPPVPVDAAGDPIKKGLSASDAVHLPTGAKEGIPKKVIHSASCSV